MKKITKNDLKRLTEIFPIFDQEALQKVRGGYSAQEIEDYLMGQLGNSGTSYTDGNGNTTWHANDGSSSRPYTQDQFDNWPEGTWQGGYVDGWGWVGPEVTIYGGYNASFYVNGIPYQPWSGGGINASFSLYGNVIRNGNTVMVAASMSGAYVSQSQVGAIVEVRVNGQLRTTKSLSISSGIIYQSGTTPLGFATFDLSEYSGQIEMKIIAGYSNNNSGTGYVGNTASSTIYSTYK